ncbi:rRNA methyltransferase [Microbulbifer flavimaris]|uniref:rRNA methyltransferase n=1 Tax=Microbulbifer flavimaris TaxID=1781068 RepID=A0ABX4I3N7_9GAMM|nr:MULTISPECIES: methyltransferase [Microbulbifer]KUJ84933.1 rRNA methyltransferase [Microbulbifer sp. ZGT114]PCO07035.1 rRNA methyltransferase [Microbulbifer flavimaris]
MSTLLQQLLMENPSETLWIADENSKSLLFSGFSYSGDLLTNRWDIARLAEGKVRHSFFNDFRLDETERHYRRIVYPVSKEKAVVHHVINECHRALGLGGELALLGGKQSGIKTYAAKTASCFGSSKQLEKHGSEYLSLNILHSPLSAENRLDEDNYPELRALEKIDGLCSKPGLFGWNKVDTGSALLAGTFDEHKPTDGASVVDLGCGYGYLSTELAKCGDFHFTATDNNAAALIACRENFKRRDLRGTVVPSDAGAELGDGIADLVICNPPFHQGFQMEGDLTSRFLSNAARLLRRSGRALFVVNEFIPLGKKSLHYFSSAKLLLRDKGFCVYRLDGPLDGTAK